MPSVAAPELLAPSFCWIPDYGQTLGPEVGELATMAGFPPDPEQQMALDATFAMDPADPYRSAVRDVAVCAPRQNLKTGYLKQAALGWLYVLELRLIVWSAHEFSTAQEAFRDMCQLIEACPDLDREVKAIHRGNGEEAIELTGDRRLKFKARTKSGGRGLTGDRIVLDEAMYLTASHLGALRPTLRAVKDPQLVLAGSAGLVDSEVWRGYRDRGRAGGDPSTVWLEWGDTNPGGCHEADCDHALARSGCALDDRARWWATNSALGRRIDEETLATDRRNLPVGEFARETLGWWDDPPHGGGVMDINDWAELAIGVQPMTAPVLSVEVSLDRRSTIGAAWLRGEVPHVEVVQDAPGMDWVADRLRVLAQRYGGRTVVLDAGTEAAALEERLIAVGLAVVKVNTAARVAACGAFHDAAVNRRLTHNGDPAITNAIANARWKDSTEGARAFSRRGSAGPIAALYAVTLALHGLLAGPGPAEFYML